MNTIKIILGVVWSFSIIAPLYVCLYKLRVSETPRRRNVLFFLLPLMSISTLGLLASSTQFGDLGSRVQEFSALLNVLVTVLSGSIFFSRKEYLITKILLPNFLLTLVVFFYLLYFTLYPLELYMIG
jgi:hypothetical protein